MARFACAGFLNFQLRDVMVFREICGERKLNANFKVKSIANSRGNEEIEDDEGDAEAPTTKTAAIIERVEDEDMDATSCEFCNFLARRERRFYVPVAAAAAVVPKGSSSKRSVEEGVSTESHRKQGGGDDGGPTMIPLRRCEGRSKSSFCGNLCERCC